MFNAKTCILTLTLALAATSAFADDDVGIALPDHLGQLRFSAPGFQPVQHSAKPNGAEIGIRAQNASAGVGFLVFLFRFPEQAPMTNVKCRDGVMEPAKKSNSRLKIVAAADGSPAVVTYQVQDGGKTHYSVRAFLAAGDICGDLEFYSEKPLSADDPAIRKILSTYALDESYVPKYLDAFLYAQLLYDSKQYRGAGPAYEIALQKLKANPGQIAAGVKPDAKTMIRVLTDQAGMSYGMSGNLARARAIFEKGVAEDPDYPMYYYNLACADAEAQNLPEARKHLTEAYARKANVNAGESMPDASKDDSFLPYRDKKDFWSFVLTLKP
jgi:tetratricopeptide (TPR) repeat protein